MTVPNTVAPPEGRSMEWLPCTAEVPSRPDAPARLRPGRRRTGRRPAEPGEGGDDRAILALATVVAPRWSTRTTASAIRSPSGPEVVAVLRHHVTDDNPIRRALRTAQLSHPPVMMVWCSRRGRRRQGTALLAPCAPRVGDRAARRRRLAHWRSRRRRGAAAPALVPPNGRDSHLLPPLFASFRGDTEPRSAVPSRLLLVIEEARWLTPS